MSVSPSEDTASPEREKPVVDDAAPERELTGRGVSRSGVDRGLGIDRSAARLSGAAAIGAALLALAAVSTASVVAFSLGAIGTATVVGGLVTRHRGIVTAGAVVLFVGALAAGIAGASAPRVLVATGAVLFAWDVGRTAVDVGTQLGTVADTTAIELRHAGASALVITLTGGVGYAVFRMAAGGHPVGAVVALLVAGTLLSLSLE